jgi:hypothetical protein
MNNKKLILVLAFLLIGYGVFKPEIGNILPSNVVVDNSFVVEKPKDVVLLEQAQKVVSIIKKGGTSRRSDGTKLASLYHDLAILIELDAEDEVIKDTLAIRESNKLAGTLSRLGLGGQYPDLAEACNSVVVAGIGDEDIVLDKETRKKAVDTFKALSWACLEGSK